MSAGSSSFNRRRSVSGGSDVATSRWAIWPERVDARVGAAGAVELEVLPQGDAADGAIDLALHRPRVLLDLPAAVPRSGVFDRQFEAGHRVIVSGRFGVRSVQGGLLDRRPSSAGRGLGRVIGHENTKTRNEHHI